MLRYVLYLPAVGFNILLHEININVYPSCFNYPASFSAPRLTITLSASHPELIDHNEIPSPAYLSTPRDTALH
jgi:hypothetical protein